jgi:hypothetical protein
MRRLTLQLSVALLTFLIGLLLSQQLVVFKLKALSMAFRGSGPSYGYVSLFDGVKLGTTSRKFASPDLAIEGLDRELSCATKILERGPKFDAQGKMIGERVVAIIRSPISGEQVAVVLWTDHSILCSIRSASLLHVLRFERTESFP